MKIIPISTRSAILLTWAELDMLDWYEEKLHKFKTYSKLNPLEWLPDTWRFPNHKKVCDQSWNNMAGSYFEFTAKDGAEEDFIRFFREYLKPSPVYLQGLNQGGSGADLIFPPNLSRGQKILFEKGWDTGQRVGTKRALNEGQP